MGKFKILQGDCLNLMKKLPDHCIDLVVTDPPYDVHAGKGGGSFGNRSSFQEIEFMSNGFDESVLDELIRVMKKINIYVFCSKKQIPMLIDYFHSIHKCNWELLTWHKTNPVPACKNKYLSDTEYIFFAREKGVKILGEYKTKKTYYVTPINAKEKKLYHHPTVKPQEILKNLIINSSNEGDAVLDPFMGSGSTGVAALTIDRNFIGFEINEEYMNTAKQRIAEVVA